MNSWKELKHFLRNEFETREHSAEIHAKLRLRKKKAAESCYEYLLCMRDLGKRGDVEDPAVIKYIVDGIEDDCSRKYILYGATNFADLRRKLEIYESLWKTSKQKLSEGTRNTSRKGDSRCYNCGEKGHLSKICPQKDRGLKCFRCKGFGHKSAQCQVRLEVRDHNVRNVALVKQKVFKQTEMIKDVTLNGRKVKALVDTGSDLSIISLDECLELKLFPPGEKTMFRGIGLDTFTSLGSLVATVIIDGYQLEEKFHVARTEMLPHPVIIGKPLLRRFQTTISDEEIRVKPLEAFLDSVSLVATECNELQVDASTSPRMKQRVEELVKQYQARQVEQAERWRRDPDFEMKIILRDEKPIYQNPRRLAKWESEAVHQQIQKWLHQGVVTTSTSEFASPVVTVRKKDGGFRLCVDYRPLNKVIIQNQFPLPVIEDQIDQLRGARVFCVLDLRNGFFHVPLAKESRKYTAFVVPWGQFEFTRAPFGLASSPKEFQRFVHKVFFPLIRQGKMSAYIDDLIISAEDESAAIEVLEEVFDVAGRYGLEFKWSKFRFLMREITYLEYVVKCGKIRPSEEKTLAVRRFLQPTNCKQLQSFLELSGYFRKFVQNYAAIAKPISDLLREGTKFRFDSPQMQAFNKLNDILSNQPVLMIFTPNSRTEVHTDASMQGLGAILLQKSNDDDQFHPVHFVSRKTSTTEEKLSSYELEVLAVVMTRK